MNNNFFKFIVIFNIFFFSSFKLFALSGELSSGEFNDNNSNLVISILSLNIWYNNSSLTKYSSLSCELEFYDDYKQKTKNIIDESGKFLLIYSNPGKVYLTGIYCNKHKVPLIYGKSRFKRIDDWGFVAHQGFVNYVGELTLKYYTDGFKFLDLLNLGGSYEDSAGVIQIDVKDKIQESLDYVRATFQEVNNFKITKSLLMDSHVLIPNDNLNILTINGESLSDKKLNYGESDVKENFASKNKEDNSAMVPTTINIYDLQGGKKYAPDSSNNSLQNIDNVATQPSLIKKPKHPYLAPIYSEFYMPLYNPYFSIGNPLDVSRSPITEVQDPVIEHRSR